MSISSGDSLEVVGAGGWVFPALAGNCSALAIPIWYGVGCNSVQPLPIHGAESE